RHPAPPSISEQADHGSPAHSPSPVYGFPNGVLKAGASSEEPGEPATALGEFADWVRRVSTGAQPVMCGYPASYDWTFLYWYLIRFTGASPFGHSGCLDMKTLYATKAGLPLRAVAKGTMPRHLLSKRRHTHHALDDAVEQAELLANLMAWPGPGA
ncbi:3'-5' exoribonuclease, partial [Streptomyces sp. NPDC005708]|uniref:3'-5' exoribonuclease domain-containing protein n=1 Tax=Streptomyces sp. NPDC005708 TaxID=3154564 RepID=UPI0033E4B361